MRFWERRVVGDFNDALVFNEFERQSSNRV